jgi:hypothetical protein
VLLLRLVPPLLRLVLLLLLRAMSDSCVLMRASA